jgi:hypothetical protein
VTRNTVDHAPLITHHGKRLACGGVLVPGAAIQQAARL